MVMLNVRRDDEKSFTCTAHNEVGMAETNFELKILGKITLKILYFLFFLVPPQIQGKTIEKLILIDGDDLDIQCNFEGIPPPTVTWSKDSHSLGTKAKVKFNFLSFFIYKV